MIVNPVSGRDVRRVAARAASATPEDKRSQVARAVVGAAAGGAERVLVVRDPFRIATGAVDQLRLGVEIEVLDVGARVHAEDTMRAAEAMREAGCGCLVVLGGDGTHRTVAKAWPDAPLVALSTGTNNVFPRLQEATLAGAAAGLVASGAVPLAAVARRAKVVRTRLSAGPDDLALIDTTLLVGDLRGSLLPFHPDRIRHAVLARAVPASVGVSPIGGLLQPTGPDDEFGLAVECCPRERGGRSLLVPISPGLYASVHVSRWRRVALEEEVHLEGPGVLAFDGDRERELGDGEVARARVVRDGPQVVDVEQTLALAAERGLFLDHRAWRDRYGAA